MNSLEVDKGLFYVRGAGFMTQNVTYPNHRPKQNTIASKPHQLMLTWHFLDKRRNFKMMHDARSRRNRYRNCRALQVRL